MLLDKKHYLTFNIYFTWPPFWEEMKLRYPAFLCGCPAPAGDCTMGMGVEVIRVEVEGIGAKVEGIGVDDIGVDGVGLDGMGEEGIVGMEGRDWAIA